MNNVFETELGQKFFNGWQVQEKKNISLWSRDNERTSSLQLYDFYHRFRFERGLSPKGTG